MKLIDIKSLDKYNQEEYVWYACYGSNLYYERFMCYINGDTNDKYSSVGGCRDKSLPIDERQYIFDCPIYFAGNSKRWNGGGSAFLDYEHKGKSYGKIYKIKMNQFIDVLKQEQRCKLYDVVLFADLIDDLPVLTFSAKHKLYDLLQEPSAHYIEVMRRGLLKLYDNLDDEKLTYYLKN